jgi:hypothetical protein
MDADRAALLDDIEALTAALTAANERAAAAQTRADQAEAADSDDAARLFRDDRAHHSEMMPPIRVVVGGLI